MDNIKRLYSKWEQFTSAVHNNPAFKPLILEGREKGREMGITPHKLQYVFLSENELKQKQEDSAELIKAAIPYMESLFTSLQGIPHMVVLSDREGWIIWMTGTPEELGGRINGLDIGANWSEKYMGNNGIGSALARKRSVLVYGVEYHTPAYNHCASMGIPIRDNNNDKIVGALNISLPLENAYPVLFTIARACVSSIESSLVTAQTQTKLDQMERLLATASLLSTTIHDIKNPLTTIRGIGQLGAMASASDKEKGYFQKIVNHVDSLSEMLNQFLSVFREDVNICSVTKILREITEEIEPYCHVQNIEVQLYHHGNIDIPLQVELFKRAIYNLLKNAVKAMPGGGKISIRLLNKENYLLISVKDTGPGLPPDIHDKIFEPFVHGQTGGTGLGLYMVHYAVTKVHKGRIWFDTEPESGTTFHIEIPFSRDWDTTN